MNLKNSIESSEVNASDYIKNKLTYNLRLNITKLKTLKDKYIGVYIYLGYRVPQRTKPITI
jgi:hypothetical protein